MDEKDVMDFTIWQVASAYIFIIVILIIVRLKKIPRERLVIIATLRMTLQLILVGYILVYVLDYPNPIITVLIVFIMLTFAIINVYQRANQKVYFSLKKLIALAMLIGVTINLIYFMFVVLRLDPWYEPQYFIPISVLIIGKTMIRMTLGSNNLLSRRADTK